jgi:hypothetical protein
MAKKGETISVLCIGIKDPAICNYLKNHGYSPRNAETRDEAANSFVSDSKPNYILIDFAGDYKKSIDILSGIREKDKFVPVYEYAPKNRTIDSAVFESYISGLEEAGILGILSKVDGIEELIPKIEKYEIDKDVSYPAIFQKRIFPAKEGQPSTAQFSAVSIREAPIETQVDLRKRRTSSLELIDIAYKDNGNNNVLHIIGKNGKKDAVTYERRIYELLEKAEFTGFLRLYDHMYDDNKLLIEAWCKDDFSDYDKNTLEDKIISWEKIINSAESAPEQKNIAVAERHDELKRITTLIADMHYNLTYHLFSVVKDYEKVKQHKYDLQDKDKFAWRIDSKEKSEYTQKLINYIISIDNTINPDKTDSRNKFNDKLNDLILSCKLEPGKRDLFDWAESDPVIVAHGDLHPRQIVYKNINGVYIPKIVDLKNVKIGPGIMDFAFMKSPHLSIGSDIKAEMYSAYLNRLKELDKKASLKLPPVSNMKSNWSDLMIVDKTWQIFWDMRVADKISKYLNEYPYYERAFVKHLSNAGKNLREFIDGDKIENKYPQAKELLTLLEERRIVPNA